jgi:hypothetical protein
MVFNATFNNISVIWWWFLLLVEETGVPGMQQFVLDGGSSSKLPVVSGVPQGSVLGPFSFSRLLMTPAAVSSQTRLFADDCILYRPIRHFSDCETPQNDLVKLAQWEQQWSMQFHPSKCNSMSVTRSKTPFKFNYILKGHTLESVDTAKYLGITISSNMTWNAHTFKTT